ncbi:hypothetical protein CROQUDRAFT_85589 [Cronartium quercuum f. sp. fusiforme G11]|uniref:Uncharacterized protein n=1 Tax=Cronartium quercuum f. sp. fusiforme G11 TaxID=708437 RepID=A0A9P6NVP6_9BASI|nr:hypothetical protein CROQUDRAFT_85589 [Cronartium quercuum f. sp. fusiforme G11]
MQVQILGCQIYGKTKEVLVKSQQDWSCFLVKALMAKDVTVSGTVLTFPVYEQSLSCK